VFAVFLLLFLLIPVLELWTIVQVGQAIGVWETIALLLIVSVVGVWLVKQAGVGVWRRLNDQLRQGKVPAAEIIDGALLLLAGLLLLLPGFLGDVLGLALLVPPVRAVARSIVAWFTVRRLSAGHRAVKVVAFGAGSAYAARSRGGRQVVDITEVDLTEVDTRRRPTPSTPRELEP
jgi:UPF0716 protein FxsA